MVKKHKNSSSGFTLVEMAAAVTVLAIGVLGTVTSVIMASNISRTTTETRQATRTGAALMEAIRAAPFSELVSAFNDTKRSFSEVMPTDHEGTIKVSVTPVDNGSTKWVVYEAHISAHWVGLHGDQTMEFVTYISDRTAAAADVSSGIIDAEGIVTGGQ